MMIFAQPTSFTAPATPAAGSSVTMIDFPNYLSSAGLTSPLAATYFTVEVGTASVTFSSTTAVNPATLAVPTSTSGGSAAAPSGSGSGAAGNGAMDKGVNGFFAAFMAVTVGLIFA